MTFHGTFFGCFFFIFRELVTFNTMTALNNMTWYFVAALILWATIP